VACGGLRRTGEGCASPALYLHSLAGQVSEDVFELFEHSWTSGLVSKAEQEEASRSDSGFNDRLNKLLEDIAKSREDAEAQMHVRRIVDTILTLACPGCRKAFVDYNDCAALECKDEGGNGCGTAFCAYCLENCGQNAHPHVRVCRYNPSGQEDFSSADACAAGSEAAHVEGVCGGCAAEGGRGHC
jgi:hypothetical protein